MGDLVVSEDVLIPESSSPSADENITNAKVHDPTPRESDDSQDSSVNDSAETVNISHADAKVKSARTPVCSENTLRPDAVILPTVKALRVAEKPDTYTYLKSAKSGISCASNKSTNVDSSRAIVDTAAPIESVRDAVCKFGGIVDWKTHKVQTLERRRHIDQELEKIHDEMIECRKRSQAAEDAKIQVLNVLERAKQQIKELEMQLNSWRPGLQDLDPAQATADEDDTREELENIVAQHEAALRELKSVKSELQVAMINNNLNLRKAGEATDVVELTAELIAAKESLNAAQAACEKVEGQRSASGVALEEDILRWEREVKQVECEVEKLNQEYHSAKDLKWKLDSASALLSNVKAELGSYIGARMKQEIADAKSIAEVENSKMKLGSAKKELEQVKLGIEKATAEVSILKLAASSLQAELDDENDAVSEIKKRGGIAMVAIQSLEEDVSRIKMETAEVEIRKKEIREKMVDLPSKLQQAAMEADQAKSLKQAAHGELLRMRNMAEQTKAEACTTETRLHATKKEIEATKASEKLALAAVRSMQESETALATGDMDSEDVVIISLEEYQMLSKCAQDAEEQAKTRLAAALIQIEAAKKSESKSLQKLEEVSQELSAKKGAYATATKKSEKAMNDKLGMEQELRSWRTKNEQRRKASQSTSFSSESAVHPLSSPSSIKQKKYAKKNAKIASNKPIHHTPNLQSAGSNQSSHGYDSSPDVKVVAKKKKKSLFPRLLTFFGRRKSHVSRKSF